MSSPKTVSISPIQSALVSPANSRSSSFSNISQLERRLSFTLKSFTEQELYATLRQHGRKFSFELILDQEDGRAEFEKYLRQTHNLEPLRFLEQVESFVTKKSDRSRFDCAMSIAERFLREGSESELNLGENIREELSQELKKITPESCDRDLFEKIHNIILLELKHDNFTRFCATSAFISWVLKQQKQDASFLLGITVEEEEMGFWNSDNIPMVEVIEGHLTKRLKTPRQEDYVEDDELEGICERMRRAVQVSDRKKMFKTYEKSFTGQEAITFVAGDQHCDRARAQRILQEMLTRSLVRGFSKKSTAKFQDSANKFYFFVKKRRLVIIGGGYAGLKLAKELVYEFEVTLIDKKPYFEYFGDHSRMMVDPGLVIKAQLPFAKAINLKRINYVRGSAEYVDPESNIVKLLEGAEIPFDLVVIATGSRYNAVPRMAPSSSSTSSSPRATLPNDSREPGDSQEIPGRSSSEPATPSGEDEQSPASEASSSGSRDTSLRRKQKSAAVIYPYSSENIIDNYNALRNAKNVVIIGSGSVAIEVAGEVAYACKGAQVTMISSSTLLLDRRSSATHAVIQKMLTKDNENLKFMMGRMVTRVTDDEVFYRFKGTGQQSNRNSGTLQKSALQNDIGEQSIRNVDVVICCTGFRPNTEIMQQFMSNSLNEYGMVRVDSHFRVAGVKGPKSNVVYPHVFALGDIAATPEERLAATSLHHAGYLAKYLRACERSNGTPNLSGYVSKRATTQIVTAGPGRGVLIAGDRAVFQGAFVYKLKSLTRYKVMYEMRE